MPYLKSALSCNIQTIKWTHFHSSVYFDKHIHPCNTSSPSWPWARSSFCYCRLVWSTNWDKRTHTGCILQRLSVFCSAYWFWDSSMFVAYVSSLLPILVVYSFYCWILIYDSFSLFLHSCYFMLGPIMNQVSMNLCINLWI